MTSGTFTGTLGQHPAVNQSDVGNEGSVSLRRKWFALRLFGLIVMAIWLAALIAFSAELYNHFFVGQDFGTYNQAWSLIGHGHFNPFVTVYGPYTFVRSDFELILWPLAVIHLVFPSSMALLVVQDLAVAGTGLVVYLWIIDYLERSVRWEIAAGVALVVLAILVVSPAAYQTVLFDFHMEPISALFLVLAGRDLWKGRGMRAWVWVALTLLCGSFAAITLIGLGLSAVLAGRDTRRQGVMLCIVSIAWLGLISLIGANAGSGISENYAYLAGRTSLSGSSAFVLIAGGLLTHPSRLINELHARLPAIYTLIKPVGVIGLASAWGFGVPFVVLMCNGLSANVGFIFEAFQSSAAYPFVLLGTVMILVWLARRFRHGWIPSLILALAVTTQALIYGITTSPGNVQWAVDQVPAATATQLNKVLGLTPARAEVLSTEGIMGRFSARQSVYFIQPGRTYPINEHQVVFVIDAARDAYPPSADAADVTFVLDQLHARGLSKEAGISAFEWLPPPGTNHLTMPAVPSGH
jgi:hypothetical protein